MLLEVHVEVLEDHVELHVGVDHVQQLDHGRVLQLLQQRDLADGGAGDALGFAAIQQTNSSSKAIPDFRFGKLLLAISAALYCTEATCFPIFSPSHLIKYPIRGLDGGGK